MPRQHIEYIQSQQMRWQVCPWSYPGSEARIKILSIDEGNGSCSVLVRLPAGWRTTSSALKVDEEFLVLEGELTLDGRRMAQDCYAWLPAGTARELAVKDDQTILLAFYSGTPAPGGSGGSGGDAVVRDAFELQWSSDGMDPAYGDAGMRWKILRHDPETQDTTMLVSTPPHLVPPGWNGPQEQHDCIEEAYVLSGDFLSPIGIMHAGAYFWRPPSILHGPYGTRGGNLTFIRTLGSALENNWSEHTVNLSRKPPHAPVVPSGVAAQLGDWQGHLPY